MKVVQLLWLLVPGGAKCAGAWAASATGAMVLSESFFKSLVADNQKTPLAVLSL